MNQLVYWWCLCSLRIGVDIEWLNAELIVYLFFYAFSHLSNRIKETNNLHHQKFSLIQQTADQRETGRSP